MRIINWNKPLSPHVAFSRGVHHSDRNRTKTRDCRHMRIHAQFFMWVLGISRSGPRVCAENAPTHEATYWLWFLQVRLNVICLKSQGFLFWPFDLVLVLRVVIKWSPLSQFRASMLVRRLKIAIMPCIGTAHWWGLHKALSVIFYLGFWRVLWADGINKVTGQRVEMSRVHYIMEAN